MEQEEEETNISEKSCNENTNNVTAEDSDLSFDDDSDSGNEIGEDICAEAKDHEEAVARSIDDNLSLRPK